MPNEPIASGFIAPCDILWLSEPWPDLQSAAAFECPGLHFSHWYCRSQKRKSF
jgi:hypothetical protein